jgi:hypothetical protein
MDARDFFATVVTENYNQAKADPANFRKLWNALVSMNSVADYLALNQLAYGSVGRRGIDAVAAKIRMKYPALNAVRECADTLKHVRRHVGQQLVASSSGVMSGDPTSYELQDGSTLYDLRAVLDQAFATISSLPEFK